MVKIYSPIFQRTFKVHKLNTLMVKNLKDTICDLKGSQCAWSLLIWRIKSLRAIKWHGAEDIIPF